MRRPDRRRGTAVGMTGGQPPAVSVALPGEDGRLFAPSAERNMQPLCDLLLRKAPRKGEALEIASGTGQHAASFARALPGLRWQPTDIAPERLCSIDAWARDSGLTNILPARLLDATQPDWAREFPGQNLVVLVNLLHLVTEPQCRVVVNGAMNALAPGGRFIVYGPFKRSGRLTSAGDAEFHAAIAAADPARGYKNDEDIENWLKEAGAATIECVDMPANNLAFIAAPGR